MCDMCCVQHPYDVDSGTVLDDNTPDLLTSGSGRGHLHADAQTLAMMLQEQLDVINNEIRSSIFSTYSLIVYAN